MAGRIRMRLTGSNGNALAAGSLVVSLDIISDCAQFFWVRAVGLEPVCSPRDYPNVAFHVP